MPNLNRASIAVLAMLFVAGCGSSKDAKNASEPPPLKDTVFGDLAGAVDKAKGVQGTIMQDKQHLDDTVEAMDRQVSKSAESAKPSE